MRDLPEDVAKANMMAGDFHSSVKPKIAGPGPGNPSKAEQNEGLEEQEQESTSAPSVHISKSEHLGVILLVNEAVDQKLNRILRNKIEYEIDSQRRHAKNLR